MTTQTENVQYTEDEYCPWMIEFRQDYIDGLSVEKRGLDATPMVMKKYDIGSNEVMTFSSYLNRNSAISVFHFHPEFPFEGRRDYMEMHSEGYEVALETASELKAERMEQKAVWSGRAKRAGRALAVSVHAVLLFVIAHNTGGR